MKKASRFFRPLRELILLTVLAVILAAALRLLPGNQGAPSAQVEATPSLSAETSGSTPYLIQEPTYLPEEQQIVKDAEPYPPPAITVVAPNLPIPSVIRDLVDKRETLGEVNIAASGMNNVWLITPEYQEKSFVVLDDISVLFGWNYEGTKLLYGRGLYETRGELAESTELWVYDLPSGETYRLIDSTKIWSASWSPVDNRVAYCEYGETPTLAVVSEKGEILQKRDEYFFPEIAWSPDGTAIATSSIPPGTVLNETNPSVLTIWWIEKDVVQPLSDAKREVHYLPLWLTDGKHILFIRMFDPNDFSKKDGVYIVNIQTLEMTPLPNEPFYTPSRIIRSPRSNDLLFWLGKEIGTTPSKRGLS